jgi:hypothetical protein
MFNSHQKSSPKENKVNTYGAPSLVHDNSTTVLAVKMRTYSTDYSMYNIFLWPQHIAERPLSR